MRAGVSRRQDLPSGLEGQRGERLLAPDDLGAHDAVASERPVQPAVGQEARDPQGEDVVVARRHDASVRLDRHGEAEDRPRCGVVPEPDPPAVTEGAVERAVRQVPHQREAAGVEPCRHDLAVGLQCHRASLAIVERGEDHTVAAERSVPFAVRQEPRGGELVLRPFLAGTHDHDPAVGLDRQVFGSPQMRRAWRPGDAVAAERACRANRPPGTGRRWLVPGCSCRRRRSDHRAGARRRSPRRHAHRSRSSSRPSVPNSGSSVPPGR